MFDSENGRLGRRRFLELMPAIAGPLAGCSESDNLRENTTHTREDIATCEIGGALHGELIGHFQPQAIRDRHLACWTNAGGFIAIESRC